MLLNNSQKTVRKGWMFVRCLVLFSQERAATRDGKTIQVHISLWAVQTQPLTATFSVTDSCREIYVFTSFVVYDAIMYCWKMPNVTVEECTVLNPE